MTQEAMKLALEALKEAQTNNDGMEKWDRNKKAITAIKEALAQPAQESVKCAIRDCQNHVQEGQFVGPACVPCYTGTPARG